MKKSLITIATLSLALIACGGSGGSKTGKRAGKTASAMVASMNSGTGSTAFSAQRSLRSYQAIAYVRGVERQQGLTAGNFTAENGIFTGACTGQEDFPGCTCSTSSNDSVLNISCTNLAETYTCDGDTYTVSNGTVSIAMDFSNINFSSEEPSGTFALNIDLAGTVSDGTESGVLDCNFTASGDIADEGDMDADCDDSSFSCTWNSEAISCSDLSGLEADCGQDNAFTEDEE